LRELSKVIGIGLACQPVKPHFLHIGGENCGFLPAMHPRLSNLFAQRNLSKQQDAQTAGRGALSSSTFNHSCLGLHSGLPRVSRTSDRDQTLGLRSACSLAGGSPDRSLNRLAQSHPAKPPNHWLMSKDASQNRAIESLPRCEANSSRALLGYCGGAIRATLPALLVQREPHSTTTPLAPGNARLLSLPAACNRSPGRASPLPCRQIRSPQLAAATPIRILPIRARSRRPTRSK
jgi:hypothetical protein